MFPQLDRDVIDDVVRVKEGRYVLSPSHPMPARYGLIGSALWGYMLIVK
jgi:hypothetical protein